MIQPELISTSSAEDLAAEYEQICFQEEQLKMYKQQIREELELRVGSKDAELIGNVSITRAKRPNYAKADLDQAKELGAVYAKTSVEAAESAGIPYDVELDTKAIEKLYKGGAAINMPITEYYICKVVSEEMEA